jgi:hypothetical protein
MVIRYNFHIENFTRYLVTGTVDSDVLESSLYIMKACPALYTELRQLRLFTTPIRLLIDPYYKTPATTSTPFHTHPSTSRYNFIPHSSLHISLQLQLVSTPTLPHPAATSFLTHPYISRCNFIPHPSLHIPLQLHSSPIATYPAATSFLTHPYISRCNFIPLPSLHIPLQLQLLPYFRKQLRSCSCPSQMHALTPAQIPLYGEFCVGMHVFIFCHPHF